MKTILAGILLLFVIANAEKPCEMPKRFVGDYMTHGYNIDTDTVTDGAAGRMFYDGNNKRMRIDLHNAEYTVIMDYQEGKQYVIGSGSCYRMNVQGPFHNISIPDNAQLVNGGRIGIASNGLDINRYFGEKDGGRGIVTVTQRDCVMTSAVSLTTQDGTKSINYFSLTDVDLTYDDDVFNKPAECHDVEAHPGSRARRSVGGVWENLQTVINSI